MARPRYVGIPTFFRAPHRESLEDVDIGIIGVPFDGGVTSRPGSRHGPREVRNASSMVRLKNQATGVAPHELCRVADVGDAWVPSPFELVGSHSSIQQAFSKLHDKRILPLAVGGDHSVSLPILRAIASDRPVGMVHIDAHCDTGDNYMGSRFHHGAPFSRAVEEGLLDPKRTIQIGIRGTINDMDLWKFSHDSGMRVVYMDEFYALGVEKIIQEIKTTVGEGPVYISFDIDSLDPAFAPGTGTPEIGGLSTLEAQLLIRGCQGLSIVGADLVEVSPLYDASGNTALAGANLLFELLCVASIARVAGA
ncbi:MAG: agmatinase [Gammaproteobacteria bacterium]|nr:agmatinase [Gammaproteobacteria bacterium]